MNNEKTRYMTFYENWIDVMEMCTPEEWYELCKIITNLRFNGVDTDAKTISNMKIKMAWTVIRPSILKSNRNSRYQDNKEKKQSTEPQQQVAVTGYTADSKPLKTAIPTEFEVPTTEQNMEEEYKDDDYSEHLNKFLDDNAKPLNEMIENIVKYKYMNLSAAKDAYDMTMTKYLTMCNQMPTEKDIEDFEKYFNSRLNLRREFYKTNFKNAE